MPWDEMKAHYEKSFEEALATLTLNKGPDAYQDLLNLQGKVEAWEEQCKALANDQRQSEKVRDEAYELQMSLDDLSDIIYDYARRIDDEELLDYAVSEAKVMECVEDILNELTEDIQALPCLEVSA